MIKITKNARQTGTGKSGSLPSYLSVNDISNVLGFDPVVYDLNDWKSDGKVKYEWSFMVGTAQCAIWDYKGARWSVHDPKKVLTSLFDGVTYIYDACDAYA